MQIWENAALPQW